VAVNAAVIACCALILGLAQADAADDVIDELDEQLTFHTEDGNVRARISGTIELEGYRFTEPAPALIDARGQSLFNPRLTTFADLQIGPRVYAFLQARADRGFDPSDEPGEARLDEYMVRLTPWLDGRFNLQVGKFATVIGSWVRRHGSWENPFVNAPLPYEHLTGMWDSVPATTAGTLLTWAHVRPRPSHPVTADEKYLRLPIIWGPSYASGFAISGELGRMGYAAEVKNAALSSRPSTWKAVDDGWEHPTVSGRLDFQPNEMWTLGLSGSTGPYLVPTAARLLPAGRGLGSYRENLLGQDIGFAWHHWQVWAELFETRFEIPRVGNADTAAYYVETKYKLTPQLFLAARWNEQLFAKFPDGAGGQVPWGADVWRIDVAVGYRLTPHAQLKLQYSAQHEQLESGGTGNLIAVQFVLKF